MNGEIPSVPITTLAGISSLTDLLPEMPLPSPLPQTMSSNKSLLFHPRVAEEANILLSLRDDTLVPQLTQSLNQTAAINIELKDHFSTSEFLALDQQNLPELLKAILFRDPGVFNGFGQKNKSQWNLANLSTNVIKPTVISPIVNHDTTPTIDSIGGHIEILDKKVLRHLNQKSEQIVETSSTNCLPTASNNDSNFSSTQLSSDADIVSPTPSSTPRGLSHPMQGSSPEQASMAPVTQVCGAPTIVPSSNNLFTQASIQSDPEKDQLLSTTTVMKQKDKTSIEKREPKMTPSKSSKPSPDMKESSPDDIVGKSEVKSKPFVKMKGDLNIIEEIDREKKRKNQTGIQESLEEKNTFGSEIGKEMKTEDVHGEETYINMEERREVKIDNLKLGKSGKRKESKIENKNESKINKRKVGKARETKGNKLEVSKEELTALKNEEKNEKVKEEEIIGRKKDTVEGKEEQKSERKKEKATSVKKEVKTSLKREMKTDVKKEEIIDETKQGKSDEKKEETTDVNKEEETDLKQEEKNYLKQEEKNDLKKGENIEGKEHCKTEAKKIKCEEKKEGNGEGRKDNRSERSKEPRIDVKKESRKEKKIDGKKNVKTDRRKEDRTEEVKEEKSEVIKDTKSVGKKEGRVDRKNDEKSDVKKDRRINDNLKVGGKKDPKLEGKQDGKSDEKQYGKSHEKQDGKFEDKKEGNIVGKAVSKVKERKSEKHDERVNWESKDKKDEKLEEKKTVKSEKKKEWKSEERKESKIEEKTDSKLEERKMKSSGKPDGKIEEKKDRKSEENKSKKNAVKIDEKSEENKEEKARVKPEERKEGKSYDKADGRKEAKKDRKSDNKKLDKTLELAKNEIMNEESISKEKYEPNSECIKQGENDKINQLQHEEKLVAKNERKRERKSEKKNEFQSPAKISNRPKNDDKNLVESPEISNSKLNSSDISLPGPLEIQDSGDKRHKENLEQSPCQSNNLITSPNKIKIEGVEQEIASHGEIGVKNEVSITKEIELHNEKDVKPEDDNKKDDKVKDSKGKDGKPKDDSFNLDSERNKRKKRLTAWCEKEKAAKEKAEESEDEVISKPKLRKIEKLLGPRLERLSKTELYETNSYDRFNKSIKRIFDDFEDVDISAEIEDDDEDSSSEVLISKLQLQELCKAAKKLKKMKAMDSISPNKITKLLTILERNIRDGAKISPLSDPNDDEEERKLFIELAMERVMRAVEASLTAMYILTSPRMQKQVYLEDLIDRVILFAKFQLHNTIYPFYDPAYRVQSKDKDGAVNQGRKKKSNDKGLREKALLSLYSKLTEVVRLLAELLDIQKLTDNSVLHASSLGTSPFFVDKVSELQLASLKLVTTIFLKYEKHRKLLLDDILASMARLPSNKRNFRSYKIDDDEYIQMLTALVLQLVQCMVVLPFKLNSKNDSSINVDVVIVNKYKSAKNIASNFLYVFLNKCSSKSEEIDYRPLFENFVQDLLTTVNKPEWPAAELMLSVLGNMLVNNFVNKSLEMTLRLASLDYLGTIAARLRKNTNSSKLKQSTIDQIIGDIKSEEKKEEKHSYKGGKKENLNDDERTQFLQSVLLDYLALRGQTEAALTNVRHFYIAQWYHDSSSLSSSKKSAKRKKKARRKGESSGEELSSSEDETMESKSNEDLVASVKCNETKKQFLLSKIRPFQGPNTLEGMKTQVLQTYIDKQVAELIARYLALKRPFAQNFEVYLKHILKVLTETSVQIRTKAMKCLTSIVEADPSVLGLKEMQLGVSHSFLDHSTSVREAAVDLVGKFILNRTELLPTYYDMLSARILDTGVSVRKRVIKILKEVCIECPDFPKVPEICVKIIRRVNDEDGIRKLVLEVFQNMWFTPVKEKPELDADALDRKVMNITDVISASNEVCIEWFEQLLLSLFKPRDDKAEDKKEVKKDEKKEDKTEDKKDKEVPKTILVACKQIVDCLIETVIKLDINGDDSQRLVSCFMMLYLFAKIQPQLLVNHAITLQPYLSLKCQNPGDYQIVSYVARTLELIVPLIEHPSEMFLSRLEEDSITLMMQQDPSVVLSCISCLGSIVNNVTRNFALIRDCLKKYHGFLSSYKLRLESGAPSLETLQSLRPSFRRSLFVVGLLLRFFDFTDKEVIGDQLPETIKDDVFNTLLFFLHHDEESQHYILKAVGSVCIRHYDLMLETELKDLYHHYLKDEQVPFSMKIQVLNNIENYLQEEERKMIRQDLEWSKLSKRENLKEMGDVTSGMASTVVQVYLKQTLESFLHPHPSVRNSALKVIQLILAQGLVHPVQIVPYLISMSTDEDKAVSNTADKQLQEIEKRYPGFIHMKAQSGIKLSYKLQKILQDSCIVRGFKLKEGELPSAHNGFLYSILRSKQQRRALVLSILKQFDEQGKTTLSEMLYLADNMAYFPYQVQDEPLYIIHHIDIIISVTGTNLLQAFREALIPIPNLEGKESTNPDEEEDEDEDILLRRFPEDTTILQQCLTASQGCLLLLVLKQHLKTLYGLNDAKITQYSPTDNSKTYEKSINRKSNSKFNPKATLQKLKEGTPSSFLDENARRSLVTEFLEFKTLIMNLDPDDADEDDPSKDPSEGTVLKIRELIAKKTEESEQASLAALQEANNPTKTPKSKGEGRQKRNNNLKAERHKKHHKRKRKRISSDDSTNEHSDPDYLD